MELVIPIAHCTPDQFMPYFNGFVCDQILRRAQDDTTVQTWYWDGKTKTRNVIHAQHFNRINPLKP